MSPTGKRWNCYQMAVYQTVQSNGCPSIVLLPKALQRMPHHHSDENSQPLRVKCKAFLIYDPILFTFPASPHHCVTCPSGSHNTAQIPPCSFSSWLVCSPSTETPILFALGNPYLLFQAQPRSHLDWKDLFGPPCSTLWSHKNTIQHFISTKELGLEQSPSNC